MPVPADSIISAKPISNNRNAHFDLNFSANGLKSTFINLRGFKIAAARMLHHRPNPARITDTAIIQ